MSAMPRLAFGLPLALAAALLILKWTDNVGGDGAAEPAAHLTAVDQATSNEIIGRASVVDGDTIEIRGTRIRLHGIDAPEGGQTCEAAGEAYRCGQRAALMLSDRLGSRTVRCLQTDVDRWGRSVAKCWASDQDLVHRGVQKIHPVGPWHRRNEGSVACAAQDG